MADVPPSRVAGLLRGALDQPESARAAWLIVACGGEPELLATLTQLLLVDERENLALDQPLESLVADVLLPATESAQEQGRIGPYRLLRMLGEGGMGSVWLAERVEGGFSQQVALKLIRHGMDSDAVTARFRREREVLASLQHADIARLLDGGVDARGRPWFAMEYVEGMDLRDWAAQRGVDLRARLELFARLCRTVAYAHQHLIVHRDLKPSNVIVRADGAPCLLDFGIAKLLGTSERDDTATAAGFLTHAYAAPEQLRGEAITTATDVYALGIVLFELLTGLRFGSLRKEGSTLVPPSIAIRRGGPIEERATQGQLRGDLDAIVMQALCDEPLRRYATAQALADDVDNYLQGRAVRAQPDGLLYRFGKFSRRNRAAMVVGSASLLALLMLSMVALWQARAKGIEAENARIALTRSESIRSLLGSIFLSADPNAAKGIQTSVGEMLEPARERIVRDAAGDPEVAATLLEQIGSTYVSLGADEQARTTLAEALEFNRRAKQPSLAVEGAAAARLAYYEYLDGNPETALARLREIIAKLRIGGDPVAPMLAKALDLQSSVLFETEQQESALAVAAESLALWQELGDNYSNEYVHGLVGYSDLAAAAGHNEDALDAASRALAHPLVRDNAAPGLTAAALGASARALQALDRNAEAEPILVRVIAAFSTSFGADSGRTYYWRYRHAQVLKALGRLDEAQQIIDAMIAKPASSEQPIAHIAYAVAAAEIAWARKADDAGARVATAMRLACAGDGNARFCAKAQALRIP